MKELKPSDLNQFPRFSVFYKYELEAIACDIVTILANTGDKFRKLPYKEFMAKWAEIEKPFSKIEEIENSSYFDQVAPYFSSAKKVVGFSMIWKNIANNLK